MIFALAIVCALSGKPCTAIEGARGPYATVAERRARHAEMRAHVRGVFAPVFARQIGEAVQVVEVCDTLERIRAVLPGAFEGEQVERTL